MVYKKNTSLVPEIILRSIQIYFIPVSFRCPQFNIPSFHFRLVSSSFPSLFLSSLIWSFLPFSLYFILLFLSCLNFLPFPSSSPLSMIFLSFNFPFFLFLLLIFLFYSRFLSSSLSFLHTSFPCFDPFYFPFLSFPFSTSFSFLTLLSCPKRK